MSGRLGTGCEVSAAKGAGGPQSLFFSSGGMFPGIFLGRAMRFWLWLGQRKQRGKEIPRDCSSVTSVLQPLSVMGVETRGEMQLTKPRFPLFKLRRKVVKEKTL